MLTIFFFQNIKAQKLALYDRNLNSDHVVVEVEVENGKMVVNALCGIFSPRSTMGPYYGVMDLKYDPKILPQRIQYLCTLGNSPSKIQSCPLEKYIYDNVRSINWNKLKITEWVFQILFMIMGDRVNEVSRPSFVESPALMVLWGIGGLQSSFVLLGGYFSWKKRQ